MTDGYWYHGNGKPMGEFCHIKPNDKEQYSEYVKVKHGRWNVVKDNYGMIAICSCCGGVTIDQHYPYCPNCGAKMDEVEE